MSSGAVVAVAGATGAQGGALARLLLQRGHHVRALARDPQSPGAASLLAQGADVVRSDFDDKESLVGAMRGASTVFVMATPFVVGGTDTEVRHATSLVGAAVRAGVEHVVYSSVASADRGVGVPHFESKYAVERHLRDAGVPWTILAPTEFLDMVLSPWALPSLRDGRIGVPVAGTTTRQLTAVDDIAAVACLAIEQPERFTDRRLEIASDVVTGDELANALSRASGRIISYVAPSLHSVGDRDLQAMYRFMEHEGFQVDVTALRSAIPEIDWHSVEAWARSQDWPALLGDAA